MVLTHLPLVIFLSRSSWHLPQVKSPLSVTAFLSPAWTATVTASTIARPSSVVNAAFIVEPPLVNLEPRERPVACPLASSVPPRMNIDGRVFAGNGVLPRMVRRLRPIHVHRPIDSPSRRPTMSFSTQRRAADDGR